MNREERERLSEIWFQGIEGMKIDSLAWNEEWIDRKSQ